jgi:hypothetical protein
MGEIRNACKNLVGKLEGVIPLGRPRYYLEDLKVIECISSDSG